MIFCSHKMTCFALKLNVNFFSVHWWNSFSITESSLTTVNTVLYGNLTDVCVVALWSAHMILNLDLGRVLTLCIDPPATTTTAKPRKDGQSHCKASYFGSPHCFSHYTIHHGGFYKVKITVIEARNADVISFLLFHNSLMYRNSGF